MRIGTLLWSVSLIGWGIGSPARGEILTFAMEGTVASIEDPSAAFDFVHLGDRVVYTFTFDSNAPDENPAPNQGVYFFLSSTLSVSGHIILSSPRGIIIQHPLDLFEVLSDLTIPGLSYTVADFILNDQAASKALVDTTLPTVPYALESFKGGTHFQITGQAPPIPPDIYPRVSSFRGPIDRFYVVPEPSSVLLCLSLLFVSKRLVRSS